MKMLRVAWLPLATELNDIFLSLWGRIENFYEGLPEALVSNGVIGVRKFTKLCFEPCDSTPTTASKGSYRFANLGPAVFPGMRLGQGSQFWYVLCEGSRTLGSKSRFGETFARAWWRHLWLQHQPTMTQGRVYSMIVLDTSKWSNFRHTIWTTVSGVWCLIV